MKTSLIVAAICLGIWASCTKTDVPDKKRFFSQFGQDKWVVEQIFPSVSDGFFVDVGAWHAEKYSNTKHLELRGWKGICIEPFPRKWKNRTCALFKEVVSNREGEVVEFRKAGLFGGIDEDIKLHRERKEVEQSKTVKLVTTTIDSVLKRGKAPPFIHYLSIDTEGSELKILSAFPFRQFTVGTMTIEHNREEPKRTQIRKLLASQGYRVVHEGAVDDYFVHKSVTYPTPPQAVGQQ